MLHFDTHRTTTNRQPERKLQLLMNIITLNRPLSSASGCLRRITRTFVRVRSCRLRPGSLPGCSLSLYRFPESLDSFITDIADLRALIPPEHAVITRPVVRVDQHFISFGYSTERGCIPSGNIWMVTLGQTPVTALDFRRIRCERQFQDLIVIFKRVLQVNSWN